MGLDPEVNSTVKALLGLQLELKGDTTPTRSKLTSTNTGELKFLLRCAWPFPLGFTMLMREKKKKVPHPDWLKELRPDWPILAGNSGNSLVLFGARVLCF